MAVTDIYDYVAARFKRNFEKGVSSWSSPWSGSDAGGLPLRANGRPFRGINVLILWDAAQKRKFSSPRWITYRQARILGGAVRKGTHCTIAISADRITAGGEPDPKTPEYVAYFRPFNLLNADQVHGLDSLSSKGERGGERSQATVSDRAEAFFASARAALNPDALATTDAVIGTAPGGLGHAQPHLVCNAQSLVDWAAQQSSLARDFEAATSGSRFDMKRELALRLSTEFLCADLGIDSASLPISMFSAQSWIDLLDQHKKAIFDAANYAQKSLDFLRSVTPGTRPLGAEASPRVGCS